jgi:hypothetical protein
MSLGRFSFTTSDVTGNAISAQVYVWDETTGILCKIYEDRDGLIRKQNPFATDKNGAGFFHALGGAYRVLAVRGALAADWRYVPVGTERETDMPPIIVGGGGFGAFGEFAIGDG